MSETEPKKYTGRGGNHGGGRKRKSESGRVSFAVSCTDEQRQAIRDKANALGLPISELVINAVNNY